jgi:hypothetical protein
LNWTDEEDAILKEHYRDGRHAAKAALYKAGFERSIFAIANRAKKLKVRSHSTGHFPKGHKTWNKGRAMPPEVRAKVSKTWFKKGNIPHTVRHDGAVSWREDKDTGNFYKWVRTSLGKWEMAHRVLWRQTYGEIPSDHIVKFIDGDQTNVKIDNLKLVTRKEHLQEVHEAHGHPAKDLSDNYVKGILISWKGYKEEEISPEMIKMYRAQLLLNRAIKNQQS